MTDPAIAVDTLAHAIADGVAKGGFRLPPGAPERLAEYLALLAKWNRVYNLTAIREPERMVTHHVLDSLAVLPALDPLMDGQADARLLDVGSGGGLPGIPLAIARPAWRVTLAESSSKKVAFLTQAVAELSLPNVVVAAGRVEELSRGPVFRVIVSRAFSDLASFVKAGGPLLAAGGSFAALKGVHPAEEIADLPPGIAVVESRQLVVPGLDAARHLILLQPKDPPA